MPAPTTDVPGVPSCGVQRAEPYLTHGCVPGGNRRSGQGQSSIWMSVRKLPKASHWAVQQIKDGERWRTFPPNNIKLHRVWNRILLLFFMFPSHTPYTLFSSKYQLPLLQLCKVPSPPVLLQHAAPLRTEISAPKASCLPRFQLPTRPGQLL